jgi:hypothetical protein
MDPEITLNLSNELENNRNNLDPNSPSPTRKRSP